MILRVGLTGGIASGKSTVASQLARAGCIVIDADAVVVQLYQPGAAGYLALLKRYGSGIVGTDGQIDRRRLADIAFASAESATELNALIHPLVAEEEERIIRATTSREIDQVVVVEATLLLESGGRDRYDRVVVVDVPEPVQIERGVSRGMTRAEVERRIAHQMSRADRLKQADYVVTNRGDLNDLHRETAALFDTLQRDLTGKRTRE